MPRQPLDIELLTSSPQVIIVQGPATNQANRPHLDDELHALVDGDRLIPLRSAKLTYMSERPRTRDTKPYQCKSF